MGDTIYRAALVGIYAAAALVFAALFFVSAPYGRHVREGWGPALDPRWAWLIMESPSCFGLLAMALAAPSIPGSVPGGAGAVSLFFLCLWELHYGYRSLVYPFLMRDSRKHPMPLVLAAGAMVYNSANVYVNGWALFGRGDPYGPSWTSDPRFIAGVALFFLGWLTHVRSDAILRGLRAPGESGYKVPTAGLFRLVSSPNYLGEMVEWLGFALAAWSLAGLSFAVFTVANLLPRSLSNHRWYLETFPDYPKERKALIPFIL